MRAANTYAGWRLEAWQNPLDGTLACGELFARMLSGPSQKFSEGIVAGKSATAAYRAAYPRSGQRAAEVGASRLLRNAEVKAEIARQRAAAEKQAGSALMTLTEKRAFLARIVRAQVANLPGDSDLVQSIKRTKGGCEIRLADKIAAIKLDTELAGDGDGGPVELVATLGGNADPFSEMLLSIRQ